MSSLSASLFVSDKIHEQKVKLGTEEHTLYFKELPAVEFRKFFLAEQSKDEDQQAGSISKLIAMSLCEPDGKPALTEQKAAQLTAAAAIEITNVILSINGMGAPGKR